MSERNDNMKKIYNPMDLVEASCLFCEFRDQDCLIIHFPMASVHCEKIMAVYYNGTWKQFTLQEIKDMKCPGFRVADPVIDPEMDFD